ncbi:penicillin-binding transpeptidase domain-containing protein [Limnochorda pilosa]|uniref:Stage V sporulation protein D n=1 Tax=Limnochorda pilosa TaxID=1555112 RepID=A0A0K2SL40_LIMPI|nr:penicillin-binding transpeptidase domain-containing protein [Limnochorda pilosa]BAS27712.1 stage V sporulation protein D [Limnochorda pilosa]
MRAAYTRAQVRRRIAVLFLVTLAGALLLAARLVYLQLIRSDAFRELALDQRLRPVPVLAQRGKIVDRHGSPLAVSVAADSVYAVPVEVRDVPATTRQLAALLNLDAARVEGLLRQRSASVWIARKVPPEQAEAVRRARLPGIYLVERPQRYYPHGSLAAQVLGIAGIDNQGLEGIEFAYDEVLRGVPGRDLAERDAAGRVIPHGERVYLPPEPGKDVVLAIDQVIQYIAEREIQAAVERTKSDFGLFVAMKPDTGEVVALALSPSFDPNAYGGASAELRRNRVVTDQFEPGSIFKVVTATAALDQGVVKPDDRFFDPGYVEIGGGMVRSWRPGGHGSLTFAEAVYVSSNPVFALVGAERLGPEPFYRYIRAYGFGQPTGIDFPGEASGYVPVPGKVQHGEVLRWANVGFGQGVAVTPIQMVSAAAAIANGGQLLRPQMVREVRGPDGSLERAFEPEPVRRVISPETAQTFVDIMRGVVTEGSGAPAEMAGYPVAGKTGTAQIPEGGRYSDKAVASFLGIVPYDRPELVGLVMLYNLKVYPRWGGTNAAPVFKAIMEPALEYLGVPRRFPPDQRPADNLVTVPNLRMSDGRAAVEELRQAGLLVRAEGEGVYVMDQTPKPGSRVPRGSTVILHLISEPQPGQSLPVPDVRGMGMRDAVATLAGVGFDIDPSGSGVAVSQAPAAGTAAPYGSVVKVRFEADRP